jgi:hypothetical protein
MFRFKICLLSPLILLLLVSCNSTGIVRDGPTRFVKPDKILTLSPDPSFANAFQEVEQCIDMQIVSDNILILQESMKSSNPYHYYAYSLNNLNFIGSLIRKGRGPDELASPRIAKSAGYDEYLEIEDNSNLALSVKVKESIDSNRIITSSKINLDASYLDWMPLPDSTYFASVIEDDEMKYDVIDSKGSVIKSFRPFQGISAEKSAMQLSSILASNEESGKIAQIMMFLPQVIFYDIGDNSIKSSAIDKDYRNWESKMDQMPDMNTVQYFCCASSSSEFLITAFSGCSLKNIIEANYSSTINIFNWEGDYLYEFKVNEAVGNMAFDENRKLLYCIDKSNGNILRYDLSEFI